MKKYTSAKHLFNVLLQIGLFRSANVSLTIKNIPTCTLFEHVQYIQWLVLIIVAKSKGLTSEV